MDRKLSLDKRFSFSRPAAESTLNGNISCNSSTFPWGQKSPNSSIMNKSVVKSPIRERTGLSYIDARTYADVKSKGLASRIVKYHESGVRINRSASMNNLSLKSSNSSQFPSSPSNKPELPYKAMKQNVSMTHIAPPDKSSFYGNTLSGLLRSTSVISLQHDDDLSSENRPIIHPPVTEKELQPTRSVLDVLKEISRKRIINEGADESDTSKKYCSRIEPDFNGTVHANFRNNFVQSHSYKRQRETNATESYNLNQIEYNSYPLLQQSRKEPSSPEQQHAKRRHCNYNNDITSSLSSSLKSSNKRKLFEKEGIKRQEKIVRYQPDIRLSELSTALSYNNKLPITPIPITPQSDLHNSPKHTVPIPVPTQKSLSSPVTTAATTTTAIISTNKQSISTTSTGIVKPKLTLFNKNYETSPKDKLGVTDKADDDSNSEDIDDDNNAYAGIQFVKPKKSTSTIGENNAGNLLIKRTQKSKLALMLSGLRGELYLGESEDEPINKLQTKQDDIKQLNTPKETTLITARTVAKAIDDKPTTITVGSIQPEQSALSSKLEPVAPVTTVTDGGFLLSSKPPPTNMKSPTTTSQPSTKITSPLTGIKLKPQSPPGSISTSNPTPTLSFGSVNTTSTGVSLSSVSVTNSGSTIAPPPFSFGLPKANTTTVATVIQPITANLNTLGGNPAKPETTAANTLPKFAFNTNSTTATLTTATNVQPTTTAPTTIIQPTTTSMPFSFGTAAVNQSSSNATTASFSFGSEKPSGGFSFGSSNTNTTASTVSSTPSFNFTAASTATTTAGGFAFKSVTNTTAPTTPGGFSFKNAEAVAVSTTSTLTAPLTAGIGVFGGGVGGGVAPIKFGSSTEQPKKDQHIVSTSSNTSLFGTKPTEQQPSTTAFGASNAFGAPLKENNMFNFGGANNNASVDPAKSSANLFNIAATNGQNQPFAFGGSSLNNKTTNSFPSTTNTPSKPFAFGSNSTINTTTTTNEIPKTSAATNTFSFSSTAQNTPFSFGGSSNPSTTTSEVAKTTNTFSLPTNMEKNKAFAFGSGGGGSLVNANPINTENNGAFSFGGGPTTENPKTTNTFNFSGSNSNNNNNHNGNSFAFGTAVNKPITNETPKSTNAFGNGTSNNAQNSAFAFGGGSSGTQQSLTFGAVANNNQNSSNNASIFSFAGANNNNKTTSLAVNPIQAKPADSFLSHSAQPLSNAFNFNKANNSVSVSPANTPAAIIKPTSTFGVPSTTPANTFLFQGGSPAPAAASTGNLFASPTSPANPTPFGAVTNGNTPSTAAIAPNMNIFAVPSSSDRPMRKATRRLTHKPTDAFTTRHQ